MLSWRNYLLVHITTQILHYGSVTKLHNILNYDILIIENKVGDDTTYLLKNFGTTPANTVLSNLLDYINNSITITTSIIMNTDEFNGDIKNAILEKIYSYEYPISGTLEELITPIVKLVTIAYIDYLTDSSQEGLFTDINVPSSLYDIYKMMFIIRHMFLGNSTVVSAMNHNEYIKRLNRTDPNMLSNANPSLESIKTYISNFKQGSYTRDYITNKGLTTTAISGMEES